MSSGQLPAVQFPGGIAHAAANVPNLELLVSQPQPPPVIPGNPIFGQAPAATVIEHLFNTINDNIDVLGNAPPVTDFHLG
jgi:hypothetical protein